MKKYFIGLSAVVLAIGLNAFIASPKKMDKIDKSASLWYYNFNPATNQITTEIGFMTHANVVSTTNCKDITTTVCAKGYSSQQTGLPKTAPSGADDVKKN